LDAHGIAQWQQHVVRGQQEEEVGEGPQQRLHFPRLGIDQLLDERFHRGSISASGYQALLFLPLYEIRRRTLNARAVASDPRRWLVLGITASGLLLICIDITVLFVALPALTQALEATNSERLWILNAYPIVVAGLLPGLGTLGDRYGHRRLFTW